MFDHMPLEVRCSSKSGTTLIAQVSPFSMITQMILKLEHFLEHFPTNVTIKNTTFVVDPVGKKAHVVVKSLTTVITFVRFIMHFLVCSEHSCIGKTLFAYCTSVWFISSWVFLLHVSFPLAWSCKDNVTFPAAINSFACMFWYMLRHVKVSFKATIASLALIWFCISKVSSIPVFHLSTFAATLANTLAYSGFITLITVVHVLIPILLLLLPTSLTPFSWGRGSRGLVSIVVSYSTTTLTICNTVQETLLLKLVKILQLRVHIN